jgi:hypothetical protein
MSQIRERFSSHQVKELSERYPNKNIEGKCCKEIWARAFL